MGEGTEGEENAVHAVMLARVGMIALLGVMCAAELDMQRLYAQHLLRIWLMRALVLVNLAVAAWDLADAQLWVRCISVLPAGGAWYAFKTSERFAGDLPWMRTALAEVRKKIRMAKGLANES